MIKIDAVPHISIRRAADIYTLIVFVGMALFIFFLGSERYRDFIDTHQKAAEKSTLVAAREVREIISAKRHAVSLFSEDNFDLIHSLSNKPDDEAIHTELNNRIRRSIPDFFASNIVTSSGNLVIGDFDDRVGDLCLVDVKRYLESGQQLIRVHPNINVYHYDILTPITDSIINQLFFVSFNLNEIADLLYTVQPTMHQLMLINYDMQELIEVVSTGGRDTIHERNDYRLTDEEKSRIMSSKKIDGTAWYVADFHEQGLLSDYRNSLIMEYLVVYFIFGLAAFYMRSVLLNEDKRRQLAESMLRQSNQEIQSLNDKLEHLSLTDALTGLYNRRYIDERLEKEWNRCQRACSSINIVLIDIDYFKKYNDYYGHQAGDDCLISVAGLMKLVFRRAGDIIARYGGEEFIVVMTDISAEEAEKILYKLQAGLQSMKIPHEQSLVSDFVTVSIGLVNTIPAQSDLLIEAIKEADKALYVAKAGGRNRIIVHSRIE